MSLKGTAMAVCSGLALLSSIERKAHERHLFKLANSDELTGLCNRRMFVEYLKRQLLRAQRWERKEAILFIDIDKFKSVNDELGHDVGDELLVQVANRLKVALRSTDVIAHYGGDEFVIHLDASAKFLDDIIATVTRKIREAFEKPINIAGNKIFVELSCGVAICPDHGKSFEAIMRAADHAMYEAKKVKGISFCTTELEKAA
ncbi:MAG: GGDEF domain-containing protein [Rickettsiales bacterium]|nr:GGDEF domain-containing protein [Rickettsiales bacterium]